MDPSILEKDENISFPQVGVLKASAGSGKTYSLTERFVQFLLSDKIPQNHLRNILAITFSNNAAKEMKERILSWLKEIHFGDSEKIEELSKILSLKKEHLPAKAGAVIEEILKNYTEFQVRTIDSFMTSIYKASAIDLGYSPDFEIVMVPERMMSYAFNRFLRRVREKTPEARFLEKVLEIILESSEGESSYLWDPSKDLLEETVELYQKLSTLIKEVRAIDAEKEMDSIKKEIRDAAERLNDSIERSGLPKSKGSSFYKILENVRNDHFSDLVDKGLSNIPVLKPKKNGEMSWYETISRGWNLLGIKIRRYIELYAMTYYSPYLRTYEAFKDILEDVKKGEGKIFINDINRKLSDYLDHEIVPDVYFRIGDTIYHYLIDEFQDTSPIQWSNLFPLIENSLSQGGSLFAVGDTKQAIYGFRDADYGIMRGLESKNPFSSAHHSVKELGINYRSLEGVVDFSKEFFKRVVASHDRYQEPARRSGLIDYEQRVKEDQKDSGYVEIIRSEKKEDEPVEKEKIQKLIKELTQRGYAYSDMAILTYRNEDVVNVTAWLNEIGLPFISYSSLDIRKRKLTAEIVSLLSFLDSPPDDLSFSGFILGEIFRKALERDGQIFKLKRLHEFLFRNRKNTPLYKAFQMEFRSLWETYFEELFKSAGYLPLYDLMTEIYSTYKVFDNFKEEEATLVKILEVIKNFEGEGRNNPKDFLRYTSDEETGELDWTINVPAGIEAVKVMTIHKAKGLGFPVAILLIYEEAARGFKYILEEGAETVHLLKINRKIAEANNFLEKRYEEERIKDMVNKLNTLYVGFTRAEDELYVVGVQGKRNQSFVRLRVDTERHFLSGTKGHRKDMPSTRAARLSSPKSQGEDALSKYQFPIDLLQATSSPIGSKHGPRLRPLEPTQDMKPYHHPYPMRMPFSPAEELNFEERLRGEFIHRVLSFVDNVDEGIESVLERIIQRVNDELKTDYSVGEMKKKLMEFLKHKELMPYFVGKPGRSTKREQDFSDARGNLFRMDRVLIDTGDVSVIDYKTGDKGGEKEYVSQLKNYMEILRAIYPDKNIEGIIAYVDLKEVTLLR